MSALTPIIDNILMPLVRLAFAVAVFVFIYGVAQMIIHETDEAARAKGRWAILGGLIGITVMLSAWGIIELVANTVGGFAQ